MLGRTQSVRKGMPMRSMGTIGGAYIAWQVGV
ncbi:hypothetical protein PSYPI_02997 [Pseudomonas syringae pv. pisi str. 1704B]|uniref:Uncharacterized protein n=1 Tax=Pseudomonas syringae pv. pisi str. 1704B TaxID=629263 RepID=F3G2Y9_PSESJ|nr:hypothetical protein PSYPI_02997 [Pseudomonas syringae pv. pisi str. 1704B]